MSGLSWAAFAAPLPTTEPADAGQHPPPSTAAEPSPSAAAGTSSWSSFAAPLTSAVVPTNQPDGAEPHELEYVEPNLPVKVPLPKRGRPRGSSKSASTRPTTTQAPTVRTPAAGMPAPTPGADEGGRQGQPLPALDNLFDKEAINVPAQPSFPATSRDGLVSLSLCTASLQACGKQGLVESADIDEQYLTLTNVYFNHQVSYHVKSLTARADELGIHRDVLQKKLWRLACAQLLHQLYWRARLERHLAMCLTPQQRVCYLDYVAYDETPMRAAMQGDSAAPSQAGHVSTEIDEQILPPGLLQKFEKTLRNDPHQVKFFQMKQSCGMVVQIGAGYVRLLI